MWVNGKLTKGPGQVNFINESFRTYFFQFSGDVIYGGILKLVGCAKVLICNSKMIYGSFLGPT